MLKETSNEMPTSEPNPTHAEEKVEAMDKQNAEGEEEAELLGSVDEDLVTSFERFALQMNELEFLKGGIDPEQSVQQILNIYGKVIEANLNFNLKPMATNLSQLTQEVSKERERVREREEREERT